jgi:hypothetical protein
MQKFIQYVAEVDDLYEIVVKMIDIIEMIRKDELGYNDFILMGVNVTKEIGRAISKKYASVMSEEFLVENQNMLDWMIIGRRRPLTLYLSQKLQRCHLITFMQNTNFNYSPMSVRDIMAVIIVSDMSTDYSSLVVELCKRNMSHSDINLVINYAKLNKTLLVLQVLEAYQMLSDVQKRNIEYIRLKYSPYAVDFDGDSMNLGLGWRT